MSDCLPVRLHKIRSYVRRQGRITKAQKHALVAYRQRYIVADSQENSVDLPYLFGRKAVCNLEIGFGSGDALLHLAVAFPEQDYVGIEVYNPGIGALLLRLAAADRCNVKVFCADAHEVLCHSIANASVNRILILFPDPWPKRRHHKRRLIQAAFVNRLVAKLVPEGLLYMVTDDACYAQHIRLVSSVNRQLLPVNIDKVNDPVIAQLVMTKYANRALRLGNTLHRICYTRVADA